MSRSETEREPTRSNRCATADLQVPDVERLLVDVDRVGACSQAAHSGQVATVAPHGLDDEDPALGATGRLLDAVARLSHGQRAALFNQQRFTRENMQQLHKTSR